MVSCKRCSIEMGEINAALSGGAIQVLIRREKSRGLVVGDQAWRDGPLCERCLAAWSALIHPIERKNDRE